MTFPRSPTCSTSSIARASSPRLRAGKPPVAELAGLLQQFFDRVTAGTASDGLIASGDLAIYADMYTTRLLDAVAEDYPKLHKALGNTAFHAVATDYLRAHPPRSFTLR